MNQVPTYGFVITRHVNSEMTNHYWNECIRCIRRYYPVHKIVIIDDNSNQHFVKPEHPFIDKDPNIQIIASEYPQRGELLPFLYYDKYRWFESAVFLHDSVFFQSRIRFGNMQEPVVPLWHFDTKNDPDSSIHHTYKNFISLLPNGYQLQQSLDAQQQQILRWNTSWHGCFGCQCFIRYYFLHAIVTKYELHRLTRIVSNRNDRCALERLFGLIFYKESPSLQKKKSLLGNIGSYMPWGYSYDFYKHNKQNKKKYKIPLVKVWTGR